MMLNTWPYSDSGLTIESNSLLVLTYFQLGKSGKLIHQHKISHPSFSLFRDLPMLTHGNHTISGVEEILEYLRMENFGLEYSLPELDLIKMKTLVDLVERSILPALDWFMWHDSDSYEVTKKYCKESLNSYQTLVYLARWKWQKLRKCRASQLELCMRDDLNDSSVEKVLYESCKKSFTCLSHILADKQFFLGETPTAADAYVFARLTPFLIVNLNLMQTKTDPHPLLIHLHGCSNLMEHARRIQESCYPKAQAAFKTTLDTRILKQVNDKWFRPAVRDAIIFGVVVSICFVMYANSIGLIHLGVSDAAVEPDLQRRPSKSQTKPKSSDDASPAAPIVTISQMMEDACE